MNRKKGHLAVVEEKQPMKHKPKRKVSELDDSAAKVCNVDLARRVNTGF